MSYLVFKMSLLFINAISSNAYCLHNVILKTETINRCMWYVSILKHTINRVLYVEKHIGPNQSICVCICNVLLTNPLIEIKFVWKIIYWRFETEVILGGNDTDMNSDRQYTKYTSWIIYAHTFDALKLLANCCLQMQFHKRQTKKQ